MRNSITLRPLAVVAAFVALVATLAFGAPELRAQDGCCGAGMGNSSNCSFRITMVQDSSRTVIEIPQGGNSWTVPDCRPFRLVITDSCGVEHRFPTVIGQCIDVYVGQGCCVRICKISACRWEATAAHCICP